MRRFFLLIALAALVATPLMAADAAAPMACCKAAGVEHTVTNLDNGVKVMMTAKDPKAVAMIQEMSATCCKDCPMGAEGVTRTVEKTSAGVTITATAANPELVKKLQAHAAMMTTGGEMKGCCKGKGDAKAIGGKCSHATSDAKQT
ncbi:MAG: hypothetical protein LAO05_00075 [Acidobacteriia bacterium]|nr:hypothetical protein [Terriglobia bacterium]